MVSSLAWLCALHRDRLILLHYILLLFYDCALLLLHFVDLPLDLPLWLFFKGYIMICSNIAPVQSKISLHVLKQTICFRWPAIVLPCHGRYCSVCCTLPSLSHQSVCIITQLLRSISVIRIRYFFDILKNTNAYVFNANNSLCMFLVPPVDGDINDWRFVDTAQKYSLAEATTKHILFGDASHFPKDATLLSMLY